MNTLLKIGAILIIIIIVGLFIELHYNKHHACMVFVAPTKYVVIDGSKLGLDQDAYVYNTQNVKKETMMRKLKHPEKYVEKKVHKHLSRKISKPFDESYNEIRESYGERMPISFMYKTAVNIADLARDLTSGGDDDSPFRLLIPSGSKHTAFVDEDNIYVQ